MQQQQEKRKDNYPLRNKMPQLSNDKKNLRGAEVVEGTTNNANFLVVLDDDDYYYHHAGNYVIATSSSVQSDSTITTVYVNNLSFETNNDNLLEFISQYIDDPLDITIEYYDYAVTTIITKLQRNLRFQEGHSIPWRAHFTVRTVHEAIQFQSLLNGQLFMGKHIR